MASRQAASLVVPPAAAGPDLDITVQGAYESPIRRPLIEAGHRALLGVSLLSEDEVIGVLAVTRKTTASPSPRRVPRTQRSQ